MSIVRTDTLRLRADGIETSKEIKTWMDDILLNREYVAHTHAIGGMDQGRVVHHVILVTKDPS